MNKKLLILIIIYFIQGIVTNIFHPVTPGYVASINLPNYMFGFFFAFMNIGAMIGAPFWGNIGDQGKKKIVLILGYSIYAISQILFGMGFIFGKWTLSIFRIFSGFGISASYSIVASEIIINSKQDKKAGNIAIGAASLGIGGALGQFLGGFIHTNSFVIKTLGTDNFFNVALFQGIFVLLLVLFVYLSFKTKEIIKPSNIKRTHFWEGFKEIKNISAELLFFLLSLTFVTIAATNVDKYFDVYYINNLGYAANNLGTFKMIVGFVSVFASLILVPIFMKFKKKMILMSVFQILSAIIIFVVFRSKGQIFIIYLYTIYLIYIIIKAIYAPMEQVHISKFSNNENMSKAMGIRQSFISIGMIIGPIFGAFIYDYNPITLFDTSVIFFLLSIVLIFISFILRIKKEADSPQTI